MVFLVTIFLSASFSVVQATEDNQDVICWGEPHFPPYVITNGEKKGQGIDDLIRQDVIEKLTGYSHKYVVGNYARILRKMENRDQVALSPLFKTRDRERYVTYANIASYLVLPNGCNHQ